MAKYRDKGRCRTRPVVAYKPGEPWNVRHVRRLRFNLAQQTMLTNWCELHGISLAVTNEGHHWQFSYGNKLAEWWPSSAKLVFDKKYDRGIHCHDYCQVQAVLRERWKLEDVRWMEGKR